MKRFLLPLLVVGALGLTACQEPNEPRTFCTKYGEPRQGSRGGWIQDCLEYEFGCLKPLVLAQASERGKFYCRLGRTDDETGRALPPQ